LRNDSREKMMNSESTMAEHAWSLEQIAAYLAGGLDAEEIRRLEAHARECAECNTSIESYQRLDRGLNALFDFEKPGLELEDRALSVLRLGPVRNPLRDGWQKRLLIAATAAVVMTAGGVVASYVDNLPAPENIRGWSFAKSKTESAKTDEPREGVDRNFRIAHGDEITNEGLGRRSDFGESLVANIQAQETNADFYKNAEYHMVDQTHALNSSRGNNMNGLPDDRGVQGSGPNTYGRLWSDFDGTANNNNLGYYLENRAEIVRGTSRSQAIDSTKLSRGTSNLNSLGNVKMLSDLTVPAGLTNSNGTSEASVKWGKVDSAGRQIEGKPVAGISGKEVKEVAGTFRPSDYKPGEEDKQKLLHASNSFGVDRPPGASDPGTDFTALKNLGVGTSKPTAPAEPSRPEETSPATGLGADNIQGQPDPKKNPEPSPRNVVIRSGDIEFEVDSFDSSAATVTKLVSGIKGAFISTTNSEKLTNGKMKGSITVRVPPEQLDGLLLDLRREISKGGELRGSKIGSQDITKQYTDLESRLKAAQAMETRLLQIIKEGKGDIKVLLEAEKELGVWRTRIEEIEGELRYYSNRVALSTLTITLTEKEIKSAATMTESERVQAGVEVEDVDKAFQQLMAAVVEAKGRVTKSDVKQLSAGQFNATLNFEVAPEAGGVLRDRLRQLGKVARLEIDRVQQPEGNITKNAKIQRGDTMFLVQLYNLANIAPREVSIIQVAVLDVPAAYNAIREAAAKTTGRVLAAQLSELDKQNVAAVFDFEVRRTDEVTLRAAVENLGEIMTRQVSRAPESENVTDAKVLYRTTIIAANQLKPRERILLSLEVADVNQSAVVFGAQVSEVEANGLKGRQIDSQFMKDRSGKVTAKLVFEVPLAAAKGLVERFKSAGAVNVIQEVPDPQVPQGKYAIARLDVTLTNGERIVADDDGVWPQVKSGLLHSASVLLKSVKWLVFGLCLVIPWVLISFLGFRLFRGLVRSNQPATVPVSAPPPTPTTT
jgi:hypothetical protein